MVVYAHIPEMPAIGNGYNPGIVAVMSFLIISGFVMTGLIRKHYSTLYLVKSFYLDRTYRLIPQFLFYSLATYLCVVFLGLSHTWIHNAPGINSLFLQLSVIPLNFYKKFPDMLLPQAWSLGLEVMFYICIPFIILNKKCLWLYGASLLIFTFACAGYISMDNWGYRYLPGVLFVFLIGNLLHDLKSKLAKQIIVLTLAFLILLITTLPTTILTVNLGRSVIIGIIIGIVVLIGLTRMPSQEHNNLAGNLSYGVFLNHNLIVGLLHVFFLSKKWS